MTFIQFGGAVLLFSGATAAQDATLSPAELQSADFKPIDMRVQDVGGVLSNSLRIIQPGLQVPGDFSQVYQLPGSGLFARVQGGITAVFPQSAYVQDENGVLPLIPAGTVFYIGEVPPEVLNPNATVMKSPPAGSELLRWDTRLPAMPAGMNRNIEDGVTVQDVVDAAPPKRPANVGVDVSPVLPPPARRSPGFEVIERDEADQSSPAIARDETYRASRLQDLLQRAADAESRHGAAQSR